MGAPSHRFSYWFIIKSLLDLVLARLVQTERNSKIDLNADYPCPCRRKGKLVPIALTEAFGCSRCQQIFVVQENGYTIEQLSTTYPYKKIWRWTGHQWSIARSSIGQSYLPLALLALFGIIILLLVTSLLNSVELFDLTEFRIIAALALAVMLIFIFWLACRR